MRGEIPVVKIKKPAIRKAHRVYDMYGFIPGYQFPVFILVKALEIAETIEG